MVDKWSNLTSADLWQFWHGGLIDSLTRESGLIDSAPIDAFIQSVLGDKVFARKLITAAVDVASGQYVQLDMDRLESDEWHKAILASASVPGIFPVTKLRDWLLIDGGTCWNLNIVGAIEKCRALGVTNDEDIIMDMMILMPEKIPTLPRNATDLAYSYYARHKELKAHYQALNDAAEFMQAHPNVQYRYFI